MPPRRQQHIENVYERDMEQRICEIIDELFEQVVDQLAQRMTALFGNHNRVNLVLANNNHQANSDVEAGDIEEEDEVDMEVPRRRRRAVVEDERRRWESGMRTKLPLFQGSLQPEEFLDWLATVEEILEFKGVLEDKRLPLVATRMCGRTIAWWQQLKLTRNG